MADEKGYNGWRNYETWCVHLWLTNEEGSFRYWRGEARRCAKEAPNHENVKDGIWSKDQGARFELASELRAMLEDEAADLDSCSLWADLLGAALSEVDWDEIAGAFLEEVEPEAHDEEEEEEEEETEPCSKTARR